MKAPRSHMVDLNPEDHSTPAPTTDHLPRALPATYSKAEEDASSSRLCRLPLVSRLFRFISLVIDRRRNPSPSSPKPILSDDERRGKPPFSRGTGSSRRPTWPGSREKHTSFSTSIGVKRFLPRSAGDGPGQPGSKRDILAFGSPQCWLVPLES